MDKAETDFMSDKKESIGLVIYQISQLDKGFTQLNERLDAMTIRLEGRVANLELWRAGFNQKIATQEQIDAIREDLAGQRKIFWVVISTITLTLVGAVMKLILKI